MDRLYNYKNLYLKELTNNIIPFWEKHCVDEEFGGYFNCLDRDGSIYDTSKFMWMQWRIVWMFSEFYNKLEKNPKWLEIAKAGYDFLIKNGKDENGWYYFELNQKGEPAKAPYNAFSDCFAVMGAAAYYKATGLEEAKDEAIRAFKQYSLRENNPKGKWEKTMYGTKPMRALGFYMMKLNLFEVLKENLDTDEYDKEICDTTDFVLNTFWSDKYNVMFENVGLNGEIDLDSMVGRQTNPGHVLEAMWFIMNSSNKLNRKDVIEKASKIILATLEYGWDNEYEGIYYFKDYLNKPHLELQWNMKLWWVHNEALIACAMAYKLTDKDIFADWFDKIHNYTWSHFPDKEYGEWFAYLDRYGNPTHMLKGGKWKCFFHLPRCLFTVGNI